MITNSLNINIQLIETLKFNIQFIKCSSKLTESERKCLMRKHRRKHYYDTMEPLAKKKFLQDNQQRYSKMDTKKKKEKVSKQKEKQQSLNSIKKAVLLTKRRNNYKSINLSKKSDLLRHLQDNYHSMDSSKKNDLLSQRRKHYQEMDTLKKKKMVDKLRIKRKKGNENRIPTVESCITQFKKKIREGPFFICNVCNRLLYKKSVKQCNLDKYPCQKYFNSRKSYDNKEYICKTCHSKVIKGELPCQAVINDMYIDEIPQELASLAKLEQILVSKRIVFQKIIVMPKGQQRKIKGAICNIPVECDQTCNNLPRAPESSGIIRLKLKRKLQFRGHVYFQGVRPQFLQEALCWLKDNNPLYQDIVIDFTNFDENLTTLHGGNDVDQETTNSVLIDVEREQQCNTKENDLESMGQRENNDLESKESDNDEEDDDPLNEFRAAVNETCLQSITPMYPVTDDNDNQSTGKKIFSIAPGENKHPVSFMLDKQCEELAFPVLFPRGRYGYKAERQVNISPVKYFNAKLLNYSRRFATNPEYLFFAQFIIEQKKVSDSMNIALKKVHGQSVTASQLRNNPERLTNLICQDQAYLFLRQIPGTAPYWQKFMYEVIAMVKQLGIPTWFMTLSCADIIGQRPQIKEIGKIFNKSLYCKFTLRSGP